METDKVPSEDCHQNLQKVESPRSPFVLPRSVYHLQNIYSLIAYRLIYRYLTPLAKRTELLPLYIVSPTVLSRTRGSILLCLFSSSFSHVSSPFVISDLSLNSKKYRQRFPTRFESGGFGYHLTDEKLVVLTSEKTLSSFSRSQFVLSRLSVDGVNI